MSPEVNPRFERDFPSYSVGTIFVDFLWWTCRDTDLDPTPFFQNATIIEQRRCFQKSQ